MNHLVIDEYYKNLENLRGTKIPDHGSLVLPEVGILLYDFIRSIKPEHTLEIGLGYGASTSCICRALSDNGIGKHIAIDPFQEKIFKSAGLKNLERFNLHEMLRFYNEPSSKILPELQKAGEVFEFAFIDGMHHFDFILIDFFYIDQMLETDGYIIFDDLWMPAVRRAISFILKNKAYSLVPAPRVTKGPWTNRLWNAIKRLFQDPVSMDWRLKVYPGNACILQKNSSEHRAWDFYRSF